MIDLAFDILRVLHMAAFAAGIGAAAFLEISVLRRFRARVDIEGLRLLLMGHDLIKFAVIGLWATGAAMIFMRVGVLGDPFSAKLMAKLGVVTLLTLNMVLIDRFLIPEIFVHEDQPLARIPREILTKFGAIAGFSAGAWLSALLLGGIGQFKAMDFFTISEVLVPILVLATIAGSMMAQIIARSADGEGEGTMVPAE